MRSLTALATAACLASGPLWAQSGARAEVDALFDALALSEMIVIMREEGLAYGDTLATDMLPGGPSGDWSMAVSAIYDTQMMEEEMRGAMAEALQGDDVTAMLDFFSSDLGARIIALEVSARRAMLDEAVDAASKESAAIAAADETPRFQQVTEFIDANDLIENNVVGALNSSYAFYMGLIDGGAMPAGITSDAALQEVWAQEDEIRATTTEWAYAFLLMAYDPLSDDELQDYIAFSGSPAGEELTEALFVAFDGMFDDISRALGLASSRFILSQQL